MSKPHKTKKVTVPGVCVDCHGLTLRPSSPLYDQGICIYCWRRDNVPAYGLRLRSRVRAR
jgi:hypothetical protein